jgi:hypothetical protein
MNAFELAVCEWACSSRQRSTKTAINNQAIEIGVVDQLYGAADD